MPAAVDITGVRFGRLVAVRLASRKPRAWLCHCDCGSEHVASTRDLRCGDTKSCGCLMRDYIAKKAVHPHTKHGMCGQPVHNIWSTMVQRCANPRNQDYPLYGGRGIRLCEEWRNSFQAFYEHIGPRPGPGYSIDRIDNEGHYEPGNVRWATNSEQARNRRPRRSTPT